MKLKISIAMLLALAPVFAQAKPASSAHLRPQLFHDRSPKARVPSAHVHQVRVPQPKSPPPPAVKEDN